MGKKIRLYKNKDKNEVITFAKDLYESGYIPNLLNAYRKNPEKTIPFVFEENGTIKGISFLHISTNEDGWLMGMRVKKQFQKAGVAITFTEEMIGYAKGIGLKWVGFNTTPTNKSIKRLTKKLKFTKMETYQIFEFNVYTLKQIPQKKTIKLYDISKEDKVKNYLGKRKLKRLYFTINPGFIWFRITDQTLKNLIVEKNFYVYNNDLVSFQRAGSYIIVNVFGRYNLNEYSNFLSEFYMEYPKNAKGIIILCVRQKNAAPLKKVYNMISSSLYAVKRDVLTSTFVVYGKSL